MQRSLPKKEGLVVSWSVDALEGVECLRATALRHHFGRHSHDAYAIGVIESGVGGNHCRGAEYFNTAGSIVVMNPGETHTGFAAGRTPLSYRMLYISTAAMQRALPQDCPNPFFASISLYTPLWAGILQRLHICLETSPDPLEIQERFDRTISAFNRRFSDRDRRMPGGYEPAAVRQVRAFLQAHYAETVTIDDLARLTRLNRAYLIRCFTRIVGLPPYAYLTQLRVERAKSFLTGGLSPAETALAVGLSDQSHLNRHFKKLTGTTPRLYQLGHYRSRYSA